MVRITQKSGLWRLCPDPDQAEERLLLTWPLRQWLGQDDRHGVGLGFAQVHIQNLQTRQRG